MNKLMHDNAKRIFDERDVNGAVTASFITSLFSEWDIVKTSTEHLLGNIREFNQGCENIDFANGGCVIHCEQTKTYDFDLILACSSMDDELMLMNQPEEHQQTTLESVFNSPQLSPEDQKLSKEELFQKILRARTYLIDIYSLMMHPIREQPEFFEYSKVAFCIEDDVLPLNGLVTFNKGQAVPLLNERYVNGHQPDEKQGDFSTEFITLCLNSISLLVEFRDKYSKT